MDDVTISVDDKQTVRAKNFWKSLAKGGLKIVPFVGGLLEEVVFGTLDRNEAQKESLKVKECLTKIQLDLDTNKLTMSKIFEETKSVLKDHPTIISEIDLLKTAIENEDSIVIPEKVVKITENFLVRPTVFISYSSNDKAFVRKLVDDLRSSNVELWFDEQELKVGDSIVGKISDTLKEIDYMILVLSEHSVESKWVEAEWNCALMEQLSENRVRLIPVLINDCEIPPILKPRLYADLRSDYPKGLEALQQLFKQESENTLPIIQQERKVLNREETNLSNCVNVLCSLSYRDLRKRIKSCLSLIELGTLWFDIFEGDKIENDMDRRTQNECVIELIDRAERKRKMEELLRILCEDYGYMADL